MGDASEENTTADESKTAKGKKETPWYIEIPLVIVITLAIVVLVQTFIGRLYVIPSQSMEPTLHGCEGCTGDRIFVDKLSYRFSEPAAGDVVVFKGPDAWNVNFTSHRSDNTVIRGLQNLGSFIGVVAPDENDLVKRIIATGGQTISCQEGDPGVMVNGVKVEDSFILDPPAYVVNPLVGSDACGGPYFGPLTVPDDHVFVMGDNRTNSADSRFHMGDEHQGTIPVDNIIGKVQAIVLPPGRMSVVDDPDIQSVSN